MFQVNVTAVLEAKGPEFALDVWKMLLSAQKNGGIPEALLKAERTKVEQEEVQHVTRGGIIPQCNEQEVLPFALDLDLASFLEIRAKTFVREYYHRLAI